VVRFKKLSGGNRWDEKAGPRRDAVRSQVIDALGAQEIKETGNEDPNTKAPEEFRRKT
jgi:hypothetical protein